MKKIVAIALAAGFCMSGQIPLKSNQDLAMAPCLNRVSEEENRIDSERDQPDPDRSEFESQKPKSLSSATGKSAARRVIEGIGPSNTTMNAPRKSAAQKAIEAES